MLMCTERLELLDSLELEFRLLWVAWVLGIELGPLKEQQVLLTQATSPALNTRFLGDRIMTVTTFRQPSHVVQAD